MEEINFLKELNQVLEKGLEEMGKKGSFVAMSMINNRIKKQEKEVLDKNFKDKYYDTNIMPLRKL